LENVGENAERDVLKTLRSLVSAINDALIYKMRSTRKPHPNPHESILVLSAASSQSIQSTAIICGPMIRSTTRQRSLQSGDSITIPNTDAIVQTDSPVLYSVDAQTQIGNRDTVHHPHSESKSPSSVIAIRAPSPSNERSRESISLGGDTTNSTNSYVPLRRDQPISRELSSVPQAFKVSHTTHPFHETAWQSPLQPAIPGSLTEPRCLPWPLLGHLDFLAVHSTSKGKTVPVRDLLGISTEWERTLGSWQRGLAEGTVHGQQW